MINKPTKDFEATTFDVALAQGETGAITAKIGTGLSIPTTKSYLQVDYNSTVALGSANAPETIYYATYTSGTGALTGVVRGQAGTTDVAHGAGAEVQCGPSTAFLEDNTGWKAIKGTFSYASATTINVDAGATAIYSVGDKLRFKQTAGTYVYFYVVTVANALLTVTGGTDYTVANETITVPDFSKSSSPVGFPQLSWTPASTHITSPTAEGHFKIEGKFATVWGNLAGTSNSTAFTITGFPVAPHITAAYFYSPATYGTDNTTQLANLPSFFIAKDTTSASFLSGAAYSGIWTASGTKEVQFCITYPIA